MDIKLNTPGNGNAKRFDNYKIFRLQAVQAHAMRRAGEPWQAGLRFERIMIAALTVLAIAAMVVLFRAAR
jgi:hypothetical protein